MFASNDAHLVGIFTQVLDFATQNQVAGDSTTPGDIGTLTDSNSNKFTVRDIQVALKQGLTERVTFSVKVDGPVAYYPMDGVASGDYTLWVKILADSGYWQTYQVPIVVKYDDQTITP